MTRACWPWRRLAVEHGTDIFERAAPLWPAIHAAAAADPTVGAYWTRVTAGFGFAIPGAFGVRHFASTGQVWQFLGFATYGDGPSGTTVLS